jgi:hypothetical protein
MGSGHLSLSGRRSKKEDLPFSPRTPPSEESEGDDLALVEYEKISGREKVGEVREDAVLESRRGVGDDNQEAARISSLGRILCDPPRREVVIVGVRATEVGAIAACGRARGVRHGSQRLPCYSAKKEGASEGWAGGVYPKC